MRPIQDRESPIPRVGEDYVHRPPLRIAFDGTAVSGGNVPATGHAIGELDRIALSGPFTLNEGY